MSKSSKEDKKFQVDLFERITYAGYFAARKSGNLYTLQARNDSEDYWQIDVTREELIKIKDGIEGILK